MTDWDAALYRQFEQERTRPAADLLAQVGDIAPARAVDLGCGPGNSTELLVRRFPKAAITGTDLSDDMLSAARERLPGCTFLTGDIATWRPAEAPDLIFANASLQWVPDHTTLLPGLLDLLAPRGTLAVQMPYNRDEPSHAAMRAVAAQAPFSAYVGETAAGRVEVLPAAGYYDLLAPRAASLDLWLTTYQHPMPSPAAIVTWVRATGLRPFLEKLPSELREEFLVRYDAAIDAAYPARADGRRLLAFPRLFIVARKG